MPNPIARTAYTLGQGARLGLFWGQSWLSGRLTKPVRRAGQADDDTAPEAGGFPDRNQIWSDLRALMIRDWQNIEAGIYRVPHDLATSPLRAASLARRYFADLPKVERRRHRGDAVEVRRGPVDRQAYPPYYLQNFHYQTDGYLSDESAALYDHQVEILFGGGADAMRRQALVPLKAALAERGLKESRMIDVACGTGQFLTFVKDNYPRLPVTALDLSPHYLEEARKRLRPWRDVEFLRAPAEASGLADESYDVATCIFLFHELPRKVRDQVAAEIRRLLKPGGRLIFVDSIQRGDKPGYDRLLERFPVAFHEPYYADYARDDLAALFGKAGFAVEGTELAYFSKVVTLRKA